MKCCIKDEFYQNAGFEDEIIAIKQSEFNSVFLTMRKKDKTTITDEELLNKIKICKKYGVPIEFLHLAIDKELNDMWREGKKGEEYLEKMKTTIKTAKDEGINLFVFHGYYKNEMTEPTQIGFSRFCNLVEFCKTLNVRLAVENVDNPVLDYFLLKNLVYSNVGFCFDSGHFNVFGSYNNADLLDEFKSNLIAVHLHDNDKKTDLHNLPKEFPSTVDFEKMVKVLKQNLIGQCYTLEVTKKTDKICTQKDLIDYLDSAYKSLEKILN